jgi:methyl-accepting chemotaxis protein-1 (serine sensor receptor)
MQQATQRVSNILIEISSASREQSNGISQVSDAVIQMDQATQQNAALVEEIANTATGLKKQAAELVRQMAQFTVEDEKRGTLLLA